MAAPKKEQKSALEWCLHESIGAYPDTSHLKLFELFENSGETTAGLDRFRQLWNKAFVGSKAFGQTRQVDIKKLSEQLVYESDIVVNAEFLRASRRTNKPSYLQNRPGDVSSSSAQAFASLKQLQICEIDRQRLEGTAKGIHISSMRYPTKTANQALTIRKALRVMYSFNYLSLLFRIIFYWYLSDSQGIRISWTGNRKPPAAKCSTLDSVYFGSPECIYGIGEPKTNISSLKTTALVVIYSPDILCKQPFLTISSSGY